MKRYTTVSDSSENSSRMKDSDSVSVASSHRRFTAHKRINSELSEPLTSTTSTSVLDESFGGGSGDPYFVFRSDLQNKLELADEFLADFLRIVHETVRNCFVVFGIYFCEETFLITQSHSNAARFFSERIPLSIRLNIKIPRNN